MTIRDSLDHLLTGAGRASVAHYDRGVHELQRFVGDPVGSADAAIAADPGFVMAHVLKGWLYGLATERDAMADCEGEPRGRAGARRHRPREGSCRGAWPSGCWPLA